MLIFKPHKNSTGVKTCAVLNYNIINRCIRPLEPTLGSVFYAWLDLKRFEISEGTEKNILARWRNNYAGYAHRPITSFTAPELQQITLNLAKRYVDIKHSFSVLRNVFKHAKRLGFISTDPTANLMVPKPRRKAPTNNYYTKEELDKFLRLAKAQLPHQWYVFFYLLAHTGLRRGEALALKWVDLSRDSLLVRRTLSATLTGHAVSDTAKTSASYRRVYIDSDVYNLLVSLFSSSEFIFSNTKGGHITSSQPIRWLHKIRGIRYISPHGFRHTHCSLLFSAGVDIPTVQKRLGHSDLKTTMQVYNHVYRDDEFRALDKYKEFMDR